MIKIELNDVGKKFSSQWLFSNITVGIHEGEKVAVLGHNGKGKSTLLQIISGFVRPTTGSVIFKINDREISKDEIYKYFSYAAPYLELPEELTAPEFLDFYIKHQPFMQGISPSSIIDISSLTDVNHKIIRAFSSGMKQRLKLACALLSLSPIVLLDEPLTNLDDHGVAFYKEMINHYTKDKIIIVCSNSVTDETYFCTKNIRLD